MVESKDEKRISLRVAPSLYNKVSAAASERNLTINAFVIQALEHSIDSDFEGRLAIIEEKLRTLTDGP